MKAILELDEMPDVCLCCPCCQGTGTLWCGKTENEIETIVAKYGKNDDCPIRQVEYSYDEVMRALEIACKRLEQAVYDLDGEGYYYLSKHFMSENKCLACCDKDDFITYFLKQATISEVRDD